MANSLFPTIFKQPFCAALLASLTAACGSFTASDSNKDDLLRSQISYPFIGTAPLGQSNRKEKFVIRSISGAQEYVIEIPGGGEDYDIEIPLAPFAQESRANANEPTGLASSVGTDRELINDLPDAAAANPSEAALIDKTYGVAEANGPTQSPSYSLGLAKVKKHYVARNFEYALIEINNLLNFYPNSPQLHKMKGSVFLKLQNYHLAEKSWITALDLSPDDRLLRIGLRRLQEKIRAAVYSGASSASSSSSSSSSGSGAPEGTSGTGTPVPLFQNPQQSPPMAQAIPPVAAAPVAAAPAPVAPAPAPAVQAAAPSAPFGKVESVDEGTDQDNAVDDFGDEAPSQPIAAPPPSGPAPLPDA